MRIRAKRSSALSTRGESSTLEPTEVRLPALAPSVHPFRVFVLPQGTSSAARIVTIPSPAASNPGRYYICPQKGFYEITRVSASTRQCRSWLLAPQSSISTSALDHGGREQQESTPSQGDGHVIQAPDLFVATPIDPLFLILPTLTCGDDNTAQEYLAASDFLTKLSASSPQLGQLLRLAAAKTPAELLEDRLRAVCDCMDMGDERMYALSLPRLARELVNKAKKMSLNGLPKSMEAKFVKQALEVPILSVKREDSSINAICIDDAAGAERHPSFTSSIGETPFAATPVGSTASTATTAPDLSDDVVTLLRLRTALNYLLASYVSPGLRSRLGPLFVDVRISSVDFAPLDTHLAQVAKLKQEAQVLRSIGDNISRKRNSAFGIDDETAEIAETKRRKREEEQDARKKNVSQGVRKLLKADKSGMKKLSAFFVAAQSKK